MTAEAEGRRSGPRTCAGCYRFAREQRQPARPRVRRLRRADLAVASGWPSCAADEAAAPYAVERIALDVVPPHQPGDPGDRDRHRLHGDAGRGPRALPGAGAGDGRADGGLPRRARLAGRRARSTSPTATTLRRTLQELVASGVLDGLRRRHRDGVADRARTSTWWPRSTATPRSTSSSTGRSASWRCWPRPRATPVTSWRWPTAEALRLRELLKFDFFFAGRHEFGAEHRRGAARRRGSRATSRRKADTAELRARLATTAGRMSRTWCCGRSSTPTTSSPTGWPTWRATFDEAEFLDDCLRGRAAVGAPGPDRQRRVGDPRAVQDGPAARRPPRPARLRDPRPGQAPRELRGRDRGVDHGRIDTIAEFHRAGRA